MEYDVSTTERRHTAPYARRDPVRGPCGKSDACGFRTERGAGTRPPRFSRYPRGVCKIIRTEHMCDKIKQARTADSVGYRCPDHEDLSMIMRWVKIMWPPKITYTPKITRTHH